MWSALQASPIRLVLLLVWFPQGWTLDIHRLNREDGACVVGGRTTVCELGCPFRVCVAYFSASPADFSASFVCLLFFVEIEVITVVLRVKLLSLHPTWPFGLQWRIHGLPITLGDGCTTSLWLISAHRPWGVFTRLSGEVRKELRGVCTQTFTPNFLQENSLFFTTQVSFL